MFLSSFPTLLSPLSTWISPLELCVRHPHTPPRYRPHLCLFSKPFFLLPLPCLPNTSLLRPRPFPSAPTTLTAIIIDSIHLPDPPAANPRRTFLVCCPSTSSFPPPSHPPSQTASYAPGDGRLSERKVKPVPFSFLVGGSIALFYSAATEWVSAAEIPTRTQLRGCPPRTSFPSQAQIVPPALIERGRG